jgi:hypothetical protein
MFCSFDVALGPVGLTTPIERLGCLLDVERGRRRHRQRRGKYQGADEQETGEESVQGKFHAKTKPALGRLLA